tara:strand:+ start:645 stop:1055 length:411 start_codon:yes stop_codon:yes gene_type:complete
MKKTKKKTNIKTIIRQIVREEVAMAIKEVVTELKQPTQSKPQPQKKIVEKKQYTDNSILNDVLNETAQDDGWKTMGGGQYTSDKMNEVIGKNYGDMMNGTSQQVVPPSDPMSQFVNKDYSKVLEKSIEKSKNKLGR